MPKSTPNSLIVRDMCELMPSHDGEVCRAWHRGHTDEMSGELSNATIPMRFGLLPPGR